MEPAATGWGWVAAMRSTDCSRLPIFRSCSSEHPARAAGNSSCSPRSPCSRDGRLELLEPTGELGAVDVHLLQLGQNLVRLGLLGVAGACLGPSGGLAGRDRPQDHLLGCLVDGEQSTQLVEGPLLLLTAGVPVSDDASCGGVAILEPAAKGP